MATAAESLRTQLASAERELEERLAAYHDARERRDRIKAELAETLREHRAAQAAVDWSAREAFPWTAAIERALRDVFHIPTFRPLQREAINAVLSGRDVMALMPTGGGKSLLFQLPATLGGLTLVVSPLVALMHDQVEQLQERGIRAALLTQQTPKEAQRELLAAIADAQHPLALLYVTPERVAQSKQLMGRLEKAAKPQPADGAARLRRIVVDECHCISQWGHDWRRDYLKLGVLRQQLRGVPIIALTATATARVRRDVSASLGIEGCELFRASVDRPNLRFGVLPKPDAVADASRLVIELVQTRFPAQRGIIYAFSKREAEALTDALVGAGVRAQLYHADLTMYDADGVSGRMDVHARWHDGRTHVVVATCAFGMGINQLHVRFVLHHTLARSLSALYQEAGRAGRDGAPAACLTLYRPADVVRVCTFGVGGGKRADAVDEEVLGVVSFCEQLLGRPEADEEGGAWPLARALLLCHFGEGPAAEAVAGPADDGGGAARGAIDLTSDGAPAATRDPPRSSPGTDLAPDARVVLGIVRALGACERRLTLAQLEACWKGVGRKAEWGLAEVGRADPALSKLERERRLMHMLLGRVLSLEYSFNAYAVNGYVVKGPRAEEVASGRVPLLARLEPLTADARAAARAVPKRVGSGGPARRGAGSKDRAAGPDVGAQESDDPDDDFEEVTPGPRAAKRAKTRLPTGTPSAEE